MMMERAMLAIIFVAFLLRNQYSEIGKEEQGEFPGI